MRWSLIIFTVLFHTLLLVPTYSRPLLPDGDSVNVFARAKKGGRAGPKAGSSRDPSLNAGPAVYRPESKYHKWVYYRSPNGDIVREKAKGSQSIEGRHGDHIFELQMVIKHLAANGLEWTNPRHVPQHVQAQVKSLINSRKNVVPIFPSINIKKGQSIKSATAGKASKTVDPARDSYILLSYGTSKMVADALDKIYEKYLPKAKKGGWVSARKYLGNALDSSRVLKPGVAEPPTSDSSGSSSGSQSNSSRGSTPVSPKGKGKGRARSSSASSSASASSDSSYNPGPQRGKRKAKANSQSGRRTRQKK